MPAERHDRSRNRNRRKRHARSAFATIVGPCAALALLLPGCKPDQQQDNAVPNGEQSTDAKPIINAATPIQPLFTDVTEQVGLRFQHQSGHQSRHLLPEIQGGGACVFDFDNDGLLDIYLINSGDVPPDDDAPNTAANRLFRQQTDGTFNDVAQSSGLADTGYGMGCAAADIDNDGDIDVYITNYGPDRLYRNNNDGTFTDITAAAGIENTGWGASAAFADFDRDGLLDLYVANYVTFDPNIVCRDGTGRPDYCGPKAYPPQPDVLYRNASDESGPRFVDATERAGIASVRYAGLGVAWADLDDDGWLDIYVANDADPNCMWMNQRDGTFVDQAMTGGTAFNLHGAAEAGMGVVAGDADADGDIDLFITHLIGETNTFYRNQGAMGFDDITAEIGLALGSAGYTGFGTAMCDLDLDGDLDLAIVNGAVKRRDRPLIDDGSPMADYAEPNQLLLNDGAGRFTDACDLAPAFCNTIEASRGLVPADFDNDGDIDLLVTNIEGPARLYRNHIDGRRHWLTIRAWAPRQRRAALGSKLVITLGSGNTLVRYAMPPGGYVTSADCDVHIGLGDEQTITRIDVRWPNGKWSRFPVARIDWIRTIRMGTGVPLRQGPK